MRPAIIPIFVIFVWIGCSIVYRCKSSGSLLWGSISSIILLPTILIATSLLIISSAIIAVSTSSTATTSSTTALILAFILVVWLLVLLLGRLVLLGGVVGKQEEPVGHMRVQVPDILLVLAFGRALVVLVVGLGEVGPGLLGRGFGFVLVGFG
jgi:hypothetical protein